MMKICMETSIMNRNTVSCKQALSSFLDYSIQTLLQILHPEEDVMTMRHVSQEAGNVVAVSDIFPLTHTPPQVDEYRCKNGTDQEKDGKRKPEKTKPDKSKRENDKGLKKTKPPKRDGLASIL